MIFRIKPPICRESRLCSCVVSPRPRLRRRDMALRANHCQGHVTCSRHRFECGTHERMLHNVSPHRRYRKDWNQLVLHAWRMRSNQMKPVRTTKAVAKIHLQTNQPETTESLTPQSTPGQPFRAPTTQYPCATLDPYLTNHQNGRSLYTNGPHSRGICPNKSAGQRCPKPASSCCCRNADRPARHYSDRSAYAPTG